MTDIVEWLRCRNDFVCEQAADEIERLRADREEQYARGFHDAQEKAKVEGRLVIVDSPEIERLRAEVKATRVMTDRKTILSVARAIHLAKIKEVSIGDGYLGYEQRLSREPWPEGSEAESLLHAGQPWMDLAIAQAKAAIRILGEKEKG